MELATVIQILIGIIVTIIMAEVAQARAEGQRDRTEIMLRIDNLHNKYQEVNDRLLLLEHDFADIDPHPSKHRRPAN